MRLELRPGQVRPAVMRRRGVVVGDDPLLVVEELRLAQVAANAVLDDNRDLPDEAAVAGDRDEDIPVAGLRPGRMLDREAERRVDCDSVLAVEDRDWVTADLLWLLARHVPGLPC